MLGCLSLDVRTLEPHIDEESRLHVLILGSIVGVRKVIGRISY